MTIPTAAVDAPFKASVANQIISYINLSAGRFVFKSNGTFVVPVGVHQFRVYLAGRGGDGSNITTMGEGGDVDGAAGGASPLISAIFTGQAVGASFAIVIGDGTNDGTTKFGTLMQCTAGNMPSGGGGGAPPWPGAPGTPTFPLGQIPLYHDNGLFGDMYEDLTTGVAFRGFGSGGRGAYVGPGGAVSAQAGMPGVCVVEW